MDPEEDSYSEPLSIDSMPRMVLVDSESRVHFNVHPMAVELETVLRNSELAIKHPERNSN